ncbi:unnamed protein product [Dovyalis caffra]|uniref:Uncharacterized protein n=1 Tax=Dovyalis caffra TaxID=77055 RepID=A0AAV1QPH8_9ROSI|nr:unnamed protein product [Dovyalis caffra]
MEEVAMVALSGCIWLQAFVVALETKSSKINILQQAERLGGPILSLGNIEPQQRLIETDVAPLSITQSKNRNPVYEPLLSDSPSSRRSLGSGTSFDFFQSQSRLSLIYSRKDN